MNSKPTDKPQTIGQAVTRPLTRSEQSRPETDDHGPRAARETEPPIERLKLIMARLRDPDGGCPWDVKQTFGSIAPYTIEEAYEVADAIARGDLEDLKDELGDLLLQVVFHTQMAAETGSFDFDQVATGICEKMIRRHPHVFGGQAGATESDVRATWEDIKAAEKATRAAQRSDTKPASLLDDVPIALPALIRAAKLQKRAARVGFDWPDTSQVQAKIAEELDELTMAVSSGQKDAIEDELGDVLFSIANLARHLGIDPEAALQRTNQKFRSRFSQIEAHARGQGQDLKDMPLEEMEATWQAAKAKLNTDRD